MALSLAELEERACTGKRRYQSKVQADRYVEAFKVLGIDDDLNSYWCRFCEHFHIGHRHKNRKSCDVTRETASVSSGASSWPRSRHRRHRGSE